jgi:hypothetical protein
MRILAIELLDKSLLNPRFQTRISQAEIISKQSREGFPIRFVLGDVAIQPHYMNGITLTRLCNEMISEILEIIVFLKTRIATRTFRQ